MANRSVLGLARPGLERAHHNLAGVGADAHLERRLPLSAHAVAIVANLFLHPQGGIDRALGMILVGDSAPNSPKMPSPVDYTMWPS